MGNIVGMEYVWKLYEKNEEKYINEKMNGH